MSSKMIGGRNCNMFCYNWLLIAIFLVSACRTSQAIEASPCEAQTESTSGRSGTTFHETTNFPTTAPENGLNKSSNSANLPRLNVISSLPDSIPTPPLFGLSRKEIWLERQNDRRMVLTLFGEFLIALVTPVIIHFALKRKSALLA